MANFDVDVHLISPDFHLHKNHDALLQRSEIKLSRLSVDAKGEKEIGDRHWEEDGNSD